jgi:hypothetical protein
MVPVLFTQKNSIYKQLGCDTFDEERNAINYLGNSAVIAHPPCRLWSQMRGLSSAPSAEKFMAAWSVELIRRIGGVLEHPASSKLWSVLKLPKPGTRDKFGGFTLCIDQFWFGHPCRKKTMLYIVGCDPADLPEIPLRFEPVQFKVAHLKRSRRKQHHLPEVSKKWRSATPPEFANFLIEIIKIIESKKL